MTDAVITRSQQTNTDISALLRARHTLLWVITREEVRVERAVTDAAAQAGYEVQFWDCSAGLTDGAGRAAGDGPALADPSAVLTYIRDKKKRMLYVLRDMHKWQDPVVLRHLRSLARNLQGATRNEARALVVLTPSAEVPPELSGHATVIDYPLPERPEIAGILDDVIAALRVTSPELANQAAPNGVRELAIDAAVGLTAEEAAGCYAKSLVTLKRIDPNQVATEKKRVIAREKVLTWYDPDPRGLDAVGGLEILKGWLIARKAALTQKAREYGLPAPKGVLLLGPPGTGKSLTAKAVATAWGLPLLRLDMGGLKSKYVGESEGNIRKALSVAETVAPCILWVDEIEKAMAGATGPQGDGGVSADALGTVLSWMQERAGAVFVVATANDVRGLPPELLRKGRFDELFYIDLPTIREREEILAAVLRQFGRDPEKFNLTRLAEFMDGFTGAEIAAVVPDALFESFADGEREVTTKDIGKASEKVVPLSRTASEKLAALREWAQGRCRMASKPAEESTNSGGRALEV